MSLPPQVPAPLHRWVRAVHPASPADVAESVLPAGRAHLVFSVGPDGAHAVAHGPASTPRTVRPRPRTAHLVVTLRPGGTRAFCPQPADQLADRSTALTDLWGRDAVRLLDRLAGLPADRIAGPVLAALLRRAAGAVAAGPASAGAVSGPARALHGGARVAEVVAATGLDRRVLAARFRREIGFGPKRYARLARFERALRAVRAPDAPALAALAVGCGFADQAHLTREFRALAGATPGRLHRRPGPTPLHVLHDGTFKTTPVPAATLAGWD